MITANDQVYIVISPKNYFAIKDPNDSGIAFRAICDFNKRWSAIRLRQLARRKKKRVLKAVLPLIVP